MTKINKKLIIFIMSCVDYMYYTSCNIYSNSDNDNESNNDGDDLDDKNNNRMPGTTTTTIKMMILMMPRIINYRNNESW